MDISVSIEENVPCDVVQHDSSILDLVFVMDCTSSMGLYIDSAKQNIRSIVEQIVLSEKSDICLALIEYRDHPPQDTTYVTRVHNFTKNVEEMKQWLEECQAQGGGDIPEAVADALHDVLSLSWRTNSTKICILISDAPPHGLVASGDTFPNGCPLGHDSIKIVHQMVENNIILYTVGVEPPIVPYRDFFMTLSYITGGQYVPLENANLLAQVIIGGVREEISLDRLMKQTRQDIVHEIQQAEQDGIDEQETVMRINRLFRSKNIHVKQMRNISGAISKNVEESYSKCIDMNQIRSTYQTSKEKPRRKREQINYVLNDDIVTLEQTKRLIQKIKNRKSVKSIHTDSTADEIPKEKQDNDNLNVRKRRLMKNDTAQTNEIEDQDATEKQSQPIKKRRSRDINISKRKINKKPDENSSTSDITNDVSEVMDASEIPNDNSAKERLMPIEQIHQIPSDQYIRSNSYMFYLLVFSVFIIIIYFVFLFI